MAWTRTLFGVAGTSTVRGALVGSSLDLTADATLGANLEVKGPRPWIDVRRHGALGDGTTDDTAAIQAALDALPATGGTVYFSTGTYRTTAALTITDKNSVHLFGDRASTIDAQHAGNCFTLSGTTEILRLRVEKLRLLGNNTAAIAISLTNAKDSVIDHLSIGNFLNDGIRIAGASSLHTIIRDCRIDASASKLAAAHAINASAGTSLRVENCYLTTYDVLVDNDVDGLFMAGNILETATTGVETNGSDFVSIADWFSSVTTPYVIESNQDTTILGPRGVALSDIDHSAVTTKRFLHFGVLKSGAGTAMPLPIVASQTWDPDPIAAGSYADLDVTVTGAVFGDFAVASLGVDLLDGVSITAAVTAAGTVTVTLQNNSASARDIASSTLRISVFKFV